MQRRIQDLKDEGITTLSDWQKHIFGKILPTLHENERNWGGGVHVPSALDTPMAWACIGGSNGGAPGTPPWGPNSFIFMQENNGFFGSWRPHLEKSWTRHCHGHGVAQTWELAISTPPSDISGHPRSINKMFVVLTSEDRPLGHIQEPCTLCSRHGRACAGGQC